MNEVFGKHKLTAGSENVTDNIRVLTEVLGDECYRFHHATGLLIPLLGDAVRSLPSAASRELDTANTAVGSLSPTEQEEQQMSVNTSLGKRATVAAAAGLLAVMPHPASASVGGGNVAISWSIPNTPSSGLTNITFPITVNKATAHQSGIYFAQQYSFAKGTGYTGLQPRENSHGNERLSARFSTFTSGATTTDPHCHKGADGGNGVTCAVDFDAAYGHRYDIKIERTGTNTWTGTAKDTVTGASTHLGTYKLPDGSGNLQGSQGGFVEYYAGIPSCSKMPRSDAIFGGPTTSDAGGLSGTTRADYEYSDCVGESNYHASNDGTGKHITRGFASAGSP